MRVVWSVAGIVARAALLTVVVLCFATIVPLAFGWTSSVVLSGSMEPQINPGDIVVRSGAEPATLRPGEVIVFADPSWPGRTLVHRVVSIHRGEFVTKGDANLQDDPAPVPYGSVYGLARLRVPFVGLPVLWWHEHQYAKELEVAGAGGLLFVIVLMAEAYSEEPVRRLLHAESTGRVVRGRGHRGPSPRPVTDGRPV